MSKSIVILNGSPRPQGNTSLLAKAFTEGAEAAGHAVTEFFLDGMNIHGCKGCLGGGHDANSPCVQKDDMDLIYRAFRNADVVVLASPLYGWTISGQLKIAFDRIYALAENGGSISGKSCALLMAAGGDEFDMVLNYYETVVGSMGWNNLGAVLAGNVHRIGDIENSAFLEEARQLGSQIS